MMEHSNKRLILEAKPEERFRLVDSVSGIVTTVKPFYRDNGNLAIAFEAPTEIRITREQGSVGHGKRKRS